MRKLVVIFLMASSLVRPESSSAADFGIRGGINFSFIPSSEEVWIPELGFPGSSLYAVKDTYRGFHFGVYVRFSFAGVFLQPELLYTETGQQMQLQALNHEGQIIHVTDFTPIYSHLDLPLCLGLDFGFFRLGAGPVFSLLLDQTRGHLSLLDLGESIVFHYKDASLGYQLMAGFQLGTVSLDIQYRGNLSGFGEKIRVGSQDFDFHTKPHQLIISLGLKVF